MRSARLCGLTKRRPTHEEAFLDEVFQRADALLFGRRTYEIFASDGE
jgi:hypothetical protein